MLDSIAHFERRVRLDYNSKSQGGKSRLKRTEKRKRRLGKKLEEQIIIYIYTNVLEIYIQFIHHRTSTI